MEPVILRPSEMTAFDRGGGARTIGLVSSRIGAVGMMTGLTTLAPGAAIPFHEHNCEESVVVLNGTLDLEVNETSTRLTSHDASWIPGGVVHRFRNVGSDDATILWIYPSERATRRLVETGEVVAVGSEDDHYGQAGVSART